MKIKLFEIKTKKKKKKTINKIKQLKIEFVKKKYANNPNKLQCEL